MFVNTLTIEGSNFFTIDRFWFSQPGGGKKANKQNPPGKPSGQINFQAIMLKKEPRSFSLHRYMALKESLNLSSLLRNFFLC